jgi:hypothetical protein
MTLYDLPKPSRSLNFELGFSVVLGLYTLLTSVFSDWISQIISNILGVSESKSLPLLIMLLIAAVSLFAVQRLLERINPDPLNDNSHSDKIFTTGSFFSVIILMRVTNPCWADCLPCNSGDPWSPLITYSMAAIPMLGAAGYSYVIEKNKAFSEYLFENAFSDIHHKITGVLRNPRTNKQRYVTDKEVVEMFRFAGVFNSRAKQLDNLYLSKARQKMYLYILSEHIIADSNGNNFRVYLDTADFTEWKIRAIRKS